MAAQSGRAVILCVRTNEPAKTRYKSGKTPYYIFLDGYDRHEDDTVVERGSLTLLRSNDPKEHLLNQGSVDYNRFGKVKRDFNFQDGGRKMSGSEFWGQCYPYSFCLDLPFLSDNSYQGSRNRYRIRIDFQGERWFTHDFTLDIGSKSTETVYSPKRLRVTSNSVSSSISSSMSHSVGHTDARLDHVERFLSETFPTLYHPLSEPDTSAQERLDRVESFLQRFGYVVALDDEYI